MDLSALSRSFVYSTVVVAGHLTWVSHSELLLSMLRRIGIVLGISIVRINTTKVAGLSSIHGMVLFRRVRNRAVEKCPPVVRKLIDFLCENPGCQFSLLIPSPFRYALLHSTTALHNFAMFWASWAHYVQPHLICSISLFGHRYQIQQIYSWTMSFSTVFLVVSS